MKRPSKKLSSVLERRLGGYALAASAAGVGALALAAPAEAKIVYTKANHIIGPRHTYNLDLNHDGITDFSLQQSNCHSCAPGTELYVFPVASNGVIGFKVGSKGGWAAALKPGARIGSKREFPGELMAWAATTGDGEPDYFGSWLNVKNRYLGLRFTIKGKTHYGWARLTVKAGVRTIAATVTGYAYETIPNKPIVAGKTRGNDVTTVQSGSLGHLARGAVAVSK